MDRLAVILMVLLVVGIEGIAMSDGNASDILRTETSGHKNYPHLKTDDYVRHMVNHPAFKGFGRYLLPWDDGTNHYNTPLNNVGSLLPYHNHVDPNIVVGAVSDLRQSRRLVICEPLKAVVYIGPPQRWRLSA